MKRLGLRGAFVFLGLVAQYGIASADPGDVANTTVPGGNDLGLFAPKSGAVSPGAAAKLAQLNAQILQHPQDTALNLRYAALAEQLGERRLALAAYERILIYDPFNSQALDGVDRIRRGIQPNTTQYVLGVGIGGETNPTYVGPGLNTPEAQEFANLNVKDERTLGDFRWRTLGYFDGILHDSVSALDYAYAGAMTGPVLELMPGVQVNPAVGGGGSYFDGHAFYGEAAASATFEAYPNGAYESVRLRAAFRDYNTFFVPGQYGTYVEAVGKFTIPTPTIANFAFTVSPWVRWSAIKGPIGAITPTNTLQPGDYTDVGGRLDAFYSITDWIVFGANLAADGRFYSDMVIIGGTAQRTDATLTPGASLIFPHLFQYQNDLRFDYRFIWNASNDPGFSFTDHVFSVTAIRRF
jgi:hypothetical protein